MMLSRGAKWKGGLEATQVQVMRLNHFKACMNTVTGLYWRLTKHIELSLMMCCNEEALAPVIDKWLRRCVVSHTAGCTMEIGPRVYHQVTLNQWTSD